MIKRRTPQGGLLKIEIDLGEGSRAYARWKMLDALMPALRQVLRDKGNADQARVLWDWQQGFGYRIDRAPWTLTLDGAEWQALSRALRHQGTRGRSMYVWIGQHKSETYPNGGYLYSPTYHRAGL